MKITLDLPEDLLTEIKLRAGLEHPKSAGVNSQSKRSPLSAIPVRA